MSPEYFERLRRNDDDEDTGDRNERRQMRSLLKKKEEEDAHPYDRWAKLREVQDPLLKWFR